MHQDIVSQSNFIRVLEEQNQALQKSIRINNDSIGMSRGNAQVIEQVQQKNIELNQAIEDNNQKLAEARQRAIDMVSAFNGMANGAANVTTALGNQSKALEEYVYRIKEIQKIDQITGVPTTPEQRAALDRYNNSLAYMGERLKEVKVASDPIPLSLTNMQKVMMEIHPIVDNFVGSFGAGMANVVVQGESLIDTLKNIGKLLLSSAIQKGLQLLLMGSGGGGLAVGGLLGALFGNQSNNPLQRSGGGRVQAGQPYMTGEIGSELFIPSTNGSIISHRQLQGLGGSAQPVTVNVNVTGKISGRDLVLLVDNNRRTFS
jgi:hypothetical protein